MFIFASEIFLCREMRKRSYRQLGSECKESLLEQNICLKIIESYFFLLDKKGERKKKNLARFLSSSGKKSVFKRTPSASIPSISQLTRRSFLFLRTADRNRREGEEFLTKSGKYPISPEP